MLHLLAFCLTVCVLIFILSKRLKYYKCSSQLPGPVALPILGNALRFACTSEDILWRIHDVIAEHKHPMRFWLGPQLLVIFSDPQQVEKIMKSMKLSHKAKIYKIMQKVLGGGLVSGSGPRWKLHRKVIQPLFTLSFINQSLAVLQEKLHLCLKNLENHADGETFDIHDVMHLYSADCFGEIMLGVQMDSQTTSNNEAFLKATTEAYELVFTRMVKPWLHPDFLYNLTADGQKFKKYTDTILEFNMNAIEASRIRRNQNVDSGATFQPIVDQIGYILDKNPGLMTDVEFNNHISTLYAASSDTVTIISSLASVCLGMYPEYQQIAYEEIRTMLGDVSRELTVNDVSKLHYLDMCIKDVMRLMPIAPYILRTTVDEFKIDNLVLPKDTTVCIPIFNIHRDPKYWEHPNEFFPEHFSPQKVKVRPEFAYLPFSFGPRGCIGKTMAMMALKIILANILSLYEIQADGKIQDLKLKQDISTRPVHGCKVRLRKRKEHFSV